jgi:hypothetical protein
MVNSLFIQRRPPRRILQPVGFPSFALSTRYRDTDNDTPLTAPLYRQYPPIYFPHSILTGASAPASPAHSPTSLSWSPLSPAQTSNGQVGGILTRPRPHGTKDGGAPHVHILLSLLCPIKYTVSSSGAFSTSLSESSNGLSSQTDFVV